MFGSQKLSEKLDAFVHVVHIKLLLHPSLHISSCYIVFYIRCDYMFPVLYMHHNTGPVRIILTSSYFIL
jgi:hypothetical protein